MRFNKFFSTIQARTIALFATLFVIAALLFYFVIGGTVTKFMVQKQIETQSHDIESFTASLGPLAVENNRNIEALYQLAVAQGRKRACRVLIMDMDGRVLVDSHSGLNGRILRFQEVEAVRTGGATLSYGYHRIPEPTDPGYPPNAWAVYYTASIVYGTAPVGLVLFSFYIQDIVNAINLSMLHFAAGAALILAAMFILIVIFSRVLSRPIVLMTELLNKMGTGRFDLRVEIPTSLAEIQNMADSVNSMSEKLENLDKTRSDFVANASHELKTPLSSIKILTESLLYQQHVAEGTYREFLGDINEQIDRMTQLLDDLLVLSRTDNVDAPATMREIALDELLERAVEVLEPMAMENGVTLKVQKTGFTVFVEPTLMQTALMNLLGNGIKYNRRPGTVTVTGTQTSGWTTLRLVDTGIGIPTADLPHIFDRFYRVDKARARSTGGTGLGLSIVDAIVRMHGGSVTVESELDRGSTFVVMLPRRGVNP